MRYRFEDAIGWSSTEVAAVPRDRVERLAAYLTGVEQVEVLERTEQDATVTVRRRWKLDAGVLPPGVRGLLPEDAIGFEDHLVFEGDIRARFAIHPLVHPEAVLCQGTLELHEDGMDTALEVDAELTITPAGMALLPAAFEGGAAAIETAVIAAIRAQLRQACRAIEALLDDEI